MHDERKHLEIFLNKISEIPAFPAVASELLRVIDNPNVSTERVEKILSSDSALTVKTLKAANSAYYAIPGGAQTLRRAITALGFESIKRIVVSSALFNALDTKLNNFDSDEFWMHSVSAAAIAELLSRQFGLGVPSQVYIGGLVHDIGKVVYAMFRNEEFGQICRTSKEKLITYEEAEKELNVPRHSFIGGMVARKWNLPKVVQHCIEDHHTPNLTLRSCPINEINAAVDAVYLANNIINKWKHLEELKLPLSVGLDQDPVFLRLQIKAKELDACDVLIRQCFLSAETLHKALFKN